MQSLTYQQNNIHTKRVVIYPNHQETQEHEVKHEDIRRAVRAWAADCHSREFVAALIADEWRASGGIGLDIPTDSHRQMQKIFRWIDGETGYATENVARLTPAILAVLPLEFRGRLAPQDDFMTRYAAMEKEVSEAKQAVMLGAPRHQKMKEISEGIVAMFRVEPDMAGPLMVMVTNMLGMA